MAYEPPAATFRVESPVGFVPRARRGWLVRRKRLGLVLAAATALLLALAMQADEARAASPATQPIARAAAPR